MAVRTHPHMHTHTHFTLDPLLNQDLNSAYFVCLCGPIGSKDLCVVCMEYNGIGQHTYYSSSVDICVDQMYNLVAAVCTVLSFVYIGFVFLSS